jgi:hypothetical protein
MRWVSYLLILFPVALGFFYVRLFGVDVPHYDSWSMVPFFDKLSSGTLTGEDLFSQHNEHRILFPRLAMLLLGTATAFDNVAVMYLIQGCLVVTLLALMLAFRDTVGTNLLYFIPLPFLVFTWGQVWNMLQAFQITLVFAQTFSVLALYLLYVSRRRGPESLAFPGALLSGTVASFSAAPGLLVWPVGLLQLLILPVQRRVKALLTGVWGLAGLVVWVLYFRGYDQPDNMASRYHSLQPLASSEFFLSALGSALFRQQGLALFVGALLACLLAASLFFAYRSGRLGECSFWVALLSFSLLTLASTTLARGGAGIGGAINPKYVTFSVLAVIAAYAMLVRSTFEQKRLVTAVTLGILTLLVAMSIPFTYVRGHDRGVNLERAKERAALVLATYESQPDEVLVEYFRNSPKVSRQRASVLQSLGYSVFSEPRPRALPPELSTLSPVRSSATLYEVHSLSGVAPDARSRPIVVAEDSSSVEVTGWAVDTKAKDVAGGVYIIVDGRRFPAIYGTNSSEVAHRLGVSAYEHSGFERDIPVSEIGPGSHELSIVVVTNDERRYYPPEGSIALEVE